MVVVHRNSAIYRLNSLALIPCPVIDICDSEWTMETDVVSSTDWRCVD